MRNISIFQMYMGWDINGLDDGFMHSVGGRSVSDLRMEGISAEERGLAIRCEDRAGVGRYTVGTGILWRGRRSKGHALGKMRRKILTD